MIVFRQASKSKGEFHLIRGILGSRQKVHAEVRLGEAISEQNFYVVRHPWWIASNSVVLLGWPEYIQNFTGIAR